MDPGLVAGMVAAACSSSPSPSSSPPTTAASGPSSLKATSFTSDFSVMKELKSLAAAGTGKVATILPDTVSSTRYVEFDAPDITKALQTAGLSSSDYHRPERPGQ